MVVQQSDQPRAMQRGDQSRARSPAVAAIVLAAILLCWAAGSLAPLLLMQVILLAAALRRHDYATGLALSVLATLAVVCLAVTVPAVFGVSAPLPLVATALIGVSAAAAWHVAGQPQAAVRSLRQLQWGALFGPVLLAGTALGYALRWGPIPAWAMSGDSRNHLLIVDAVREQGGWTFLTDYPALHNASIWLLSFSHDEAPPGTELILNLQTAAQTLLVVMVLLGLTAGFLAGGRSTTWVGNLRAAAGSGLVVSPLMLSGVLVGGFHSVPMAVLVLVALCSYLLLGAPGWRGAFLAAAAAGALLVAVYPVVAPMAAGAFLGWWLTAGERPDRRMLVPAIATLATLGSLWVVMRWAAGLPDVVAVLTAPGGIPGRDPLLLIAVFLLAVAAWLVNRNWPQARPLAVTALAGLLLGAVVMWLSSLTPGWAYSYYAEKTLWVGILGLLPVALCRAGASSGDSWARALPVLVLYTFLTCVPILFGAQGVWNPLGSVVGGWSLPDADSVETVESLPNESLPSYIWAVHDAETDRRLNIWLSSWNLPQGSIYLSDPVVSWPYGATDIEAPATFCLLLQAQQDSVVWTDTAEEARMLRRACQVRGERVRVISEAG